MPLRKVSAMPDLFSPFTLKDVTLRNRIVMSPMTMHHSVDGCMSDFHVMLYGSRAAGGFGLLFPEQIAITPDGRTSVHCAGIWDDKHLEGLSRICCIVKEMGGVPAWWLSNPRSQAAAESIGLPPLPSMTKA